MNTDASYKSLCLCTLRKSNANQQHPSFMLRLLLWILGCFLSKQLYGRCHEKRFLQTHVSCIEIGFNAYNNANI